jgi:predicted porin
MNRKLISLAVAAALVAPAAAMADAVLYGRVHVSLDYQNVENVIQPWYNNSATNAFTFRGVTVPANRGQDVFVDGAGNPVLRVPTGAVLTPAEVRLVRDTVRLAPGQTWAGRDYEGWGMSDNNNFQGVGRSSILGVKGSEDLGGGLKAIYQIELDIKMNDQNSQLVDNNDGFTYRNTFVGLAGGWGTALMGRHDTPLKISTGKLDLFADTMADYNGTIGFQDLRADNAVAYISPSFSGFTLAAALVPGGGGTAGFGNSTQSDSIAEGYSIAGIYSNGPFYASAAYEALSGDLYMSQNTALVPCQTDTLGGIYSYQCQQTDSDFTKWRLGLGLLNWNGFSLTGIYEQQEDLAGGQTGVAFVNSNDASQSFILRNGPDSVSLWQIQAGYTFGNVMLKAMYGESEGDGDYLLPSRADTTAGNAAVYAQSATNRYEDTVSSWAIGADYNFSKRTMAYVLYTATDSDSSDQPRFTNGIAGSTIVLPTSRRQSWDGFSLGVSHRF